MRLSNAVVRSIGSLATPGIFAVIVQTILVTLLSLFLFVMGASSLAFHFAAHMSDHGMASLVSVSGSIGSALIAWFLFPGIMPVIVSFFDDRIALLIESREYAKPAPTHQPKFMPDLMHDIGFSLKAVFWNIICLPLYLVPIVNLCIFYVLNGYLLGREFFVMVARRHMAYSAAEALRREYGFTIFMGGVLFSMLATVPIINLIAPFCGVALAVHLFHQVYDGRQAAAPMTTVL